MKIIISRKGFDSSYGGVPSPILPDGRLVPLPIPSPKDHRTYGEVSVNGARISSLVADLTGGRIQAHDCCHLDPDLDFGSVRRRPGWRPAFGQIGAAQSHLARYQIGPGDLFLFFGWFRPVEQTKGTWKYTARQGKHVIYGWMRVADVLTVKHASAKVLRPFSGHPHLSGRDEESNTLYLAGDSAGVPGVACGGAGLFSRFADCLQLSRSDAVNRSEWRLPSWFHYEAGSTFSYHDHKGRWSQDSDSCILQSVARGQEFVLCPGNMAQAEKWLEQLFQCGSPVSGAR